MLLGTGLIAVFAHMDTRTSEDNVSFGATQIENAPRAQHRSAVDFAEIEEVLDAIITSANGELNNKLNSTTLNKLDLAVAKLMPQRNALSWSRIELLIEKSFPASVSSKVFDLLFGNYGYQSEASSILAAGSDDVLLKLTQAQQRFFGREIAEKLFFKRNLRQRYFLNRQKIRSNSSLSEDEMNQRLRQLQQSFQQEIKQSD